MRKTETYKTISGSFRDPSGYLFYKNGAIYRQINVTYKNNYDFLIASGLYNHLVENELLIRHEEVDLEYKIDNNAYKIIKPEPIPFISYPYEWCFSQLKNAALTTLKIQKQALKHGLILKDANAFNIQFFKGKPLLIDTLSFEKYISGKPWIAYKQFCQHFLAPLALMSYTDVRLNQLSRIYLDGIPLDLTSTLLPNHTRLKFSLLSHIYFHRRFQKHFSDKPMTEAKKSHKFSQTSMMGLVESLESSVKKLNWKPKGTEWVNYYKDMNYSIDALDHKKELVDEILEKINPKIVWDFGANIGLFSQIASNKGIQTISFDIDPAAVEKNYQESIKKGNKNVLPLLLDLTNPSPNIGWENQERMSILERGPADTGLALALIHHLAISNNLPFNKIAHFFYKACKSLIIEFVPKNDSQVKRLLSTREDIFPSYTQQAFENEFQKYFTTQNCVNIKDSKRTLYFMKGRTTIV